MHPAAPHLKIFVGGLHPDCDDAALRSYWEQFGRVASCIVMMDRHTGRSRGFGFVTMADKASFDNCFVQGQQHEIYGKWTECKPAEKPAARPPHVASGPGGAPHYLPQQHHPQWSATAGPMHTPQYPPPAAYSHHGGATGTAGGGMFPPPPAEGHYPSPQTHHPYHHHHHPYHQQQQQQQPQVPTYAPQQDPRHYRPPPPQTYESGPYGHYRGSRGGGPRNVAWKCFVGGLGANVDDETFRAYWQGFGPVADSVVMWDRQTGNSRGFGFVTMGDAASFNAVMSYGNHEINGKRVDVKQADQAK